jgi:hypothetical protein
MCAARREALSVSAVQKHYQLSVSAIYNPHRILQVYKLILLTPINN